MARRRISNAEFFMSLASRVPGLVALALAVASGVILHVVVVWARAQALAPHAGADLGRQWVVSLVAGIANIAQFVLPILFVFGALAALLQQRRGRQLATEARLRPQDIAAMPWRDFERLVAAAYRERGYAVREVAERSGDGGVDLELSRGGALTLVQCKHWRERSVGVTVVRELLGVVTARRAIGGIVVTSGSFSDEAVRFASGNGIELLDGPALAALLGASAGAGEPRAAGKAVAKRRA